MTIEEQLEKLQKEHKEAVAQIEKLSKNQSEQNAHITKLEAEKKRLLEETNELVKNSNRNTPASIKNSSETYERYMREKWRTEVVDKALETLKSAYPADHVELLREEVVEYCKKNMKDDTTTDKYAKRVFAMLYGEALGDKKHAIHQTDEPPKETNPLKPTPNKPLNETLTPHTMTARDNPANPGNVPPNQDPIKYKDTRESFTALEARLKGVNTDS